MREPGGRIKFTCVSAGIERFFGITAEQAMADADSFRWLIAPEDQEYVNALEEQSARELTPFVCEFRLRLTSGEIKWIQCRSKPSRLEDGSVVWDGIVMNTTESKRNECALRESEEKYRTLFESINQGFCTIQVLFDENETPVDYRFLIVNPAFEHQTGIKDAVGRRMREIAPLHEEHWFRIYGKIALTGEAMRFENSAVQLHRYYEVYAWRIGAPAERKVAILFNDITEQKQAKDLLSADLAALTRMHALSSRLLGAGGLEPLLQEIMDAAVAIVGAKKGTLQLIAGDSLKIVAHHGHEKPFLDFFASAEARASACSATSHSNERVVVPDVRVSPVFAGTPSLDVLMSAGVLAVQSAPIVNRNGGLLGILTTHWDKPYSPNEHDLWRIDMLARQAADLIEQTRASEALSQAKVRAERANEAKDRFLAALSHELRTPLTPVLAAAQMLERREDLPASVKDHVQIIKRNVGLEARLIDDLLDLNRIVHGKVHLAIAHVDIHDLIRHAAEICKPKLEEKRQQIILELKAMPHTVKGDWSRLQQVLWNLLTNAIKFTHEGGTVAVETGQTGGGIEVRVTDNGRGIEPNVLPKLFSAFEQGDTSTIRDFGGLGLGLAISRGIANMHGGDIRAFSDGLGKGASFVLTLPATESVAEIGTQAERNGGTRRTQSLSRKILLVEDNEDTGVLLKMILDGGGHRVHFASSVASALKAAEGEKFDLLLCDLGLPDGSGFDVVSSLLRQNAVGKAVALTGFGMEDDIKRCKKAGFNAHLTKPVDIDALEDLIDML